MDSTPAPKKPRRPPPIFDPGPDPSAARTPAPAPPPAGENAPAPDELPSSPPRSPADSSAPASAGDPRAPVKVKPYNGSCPNCEHGTMFPLVRFYETDVNENPTADAIMPNLMGAMFFPGASFILMMVSWIGNLTWDKGKVAKGRVKVRRARAEILPRSPQSVICPNCYEVLERM